MAQQRGPGGTALLLIAILLAVLTACGPAVTVTSSSPPDVTVEPPLGVISRVTEASQITFPVDVYVLSLRDAERVKRAQHRVMTTCMRRFGFSFEPFTERDPVALENGDKPNYDRLYGVFDEAHAATYGYHPGVPLMSEESGKELTQPDTEYSPEWRNVAGAELGGGTYRGQQIPAGGCFSEARRAVAAGGPAFDPLINEAIMAEVDPLVNADSRVRAADACLERLYGERWIRLPDPTRGKRRQSLVAQ